MAEILAHTDTSLSFPPSFCTHMVSVEPVQAKGANAASKEFIMPHGTTILLPTAGLIGLASLDVKDKHHRCLVLPRPHWQRHRKHSGICLAPKVLVSKKHSMSDCEREMLSDVPQASSSRTQGRVDAHVQCKYP